MNCTAFGQLIALYVEGDLRESDRRRVETHLQACAACWDLESELRESQAAFKDLRLGTVNSTALAEVRHRVMVEVGGLEPAPAWVLVMHRLIFAGLHRRNAIAGVLLAAMVAGGAWYSRTRDLSERRVEAPIEVARIETPFSERTAEIVLPSVLVPPHLENAEPLQSMVAVPPDISEIPAIEAPAALASEVSQIPMKFITDDPDIIIYWLPADKGD